MENYIIEEPTVVGDVVKLTTKQKIAILNEALLGFKSLSVILNENSVSEKDFYIWKEKYIDSLN